MFSADVAYDRRHCFLSDGHHQRWLSNIARLRSELPFGVTLHPGHGEPCGVEVLGWQEVYINTFLESIRAADWSNPEAAEQGVVARMREFLPSDELLFLMQLSIEPIARQLEVR